MNGGRTYERHSSSCGASRRTRYPASVSQAPAACSCSGTFLPSTPWQQSAITRAWLRCTTMPAIRWVASSDQARNKYRCASAVALRCARPSTGCASLMYLQPMPRSNCLHGHVAGGDGYNSRAHGWTLERRAVQCGPYVVRPVLGRQREHSTALPAAQHKRRAPVYRARSRLHGGGGIAQRWRFHFEH